LAAGLRRTGFSSGGCGKTRRGGGVKQGDTHGATDEVRHKVVEGKVHVRDLQATILHLMGLEHTHLTYRFQCRDYRLTDVHGNVVTEVLA
jgi:hypothetical protein